MYESSYDERELVELKVGCDILFESFDIEYTIIFTLMTLIGRFQLYAVRQDYSFIMMSYLQRIYTRTYVRPIGCSVLI